MTMETIVIAVEALFILPTFSRREAVLSPGKLGFSGPAAVGNSQTTPQRLELQLAVGFPRPASTYVYPGCIAVN
jgi:hypothetical protein